MIDSKLHFICSFLWCHLSSLLFNVWKVFFFFRLFIQILNCLRRGCESGSCSYILATVKIPSVQFGSVQLLSPVQLCDPMYCSMPGLPITNSPSLLKLMSIESVMPSNHLILHHLLLLLPSIFPSIRVFSNETALLIRCPKYWSFSFNISPSNEHSGLISFRMDWLELLAVQGNLKSLLQHHSSKTSILWRSAFFIVELSHPYMATGKTIALTRWTLVGKVMSLLFNMLSRLVTTFLPRSKHLLISCLQSHLHWFWSPQKSITISTVSPSIYHEVMLESRLLGEISITSDMQMTPPLWQKVKRN